MDISELLPILAALCIAALAAVAVRTARSVVHRTVRLTVRIATVLLGSAALVVAAALIFFNLSYTRHLPVQPSPDGRHVAITTYTINTGGADQAEVAIRHTWSPYSHRVYGGPAQYQSNAATPNPELQWLDAAHLRVRFNTYASTQRSPDLTPEGCAAQADGVTIRCEQTLVHATR